MTEIEWPSLASFRASSPHGFDAKEEICETGLVLAVTDTDDVFTELVPLLSKPNLVVDTVRVSMSRLALARSGTVSEKDERFSDRVTFRT